MKRNHVFRSFSLEGAIYSVAAAALGALVGVGVGWLIILGTASIFHDPNDSFRIDLFAKPTSLLLAAAIGCAISLLTVWGTSLRISRHERDRRDPRPARTASTGSSHRPARAGRDGCDPRRRAVRHGRQRRPQDRPAARAGVGRVRGDDVAVASPADAHRPIRRLRGRDRLVDQRVPDLPEAARRFGDRRLRGDGPHARVRRRRHRHHARPHVGPAHAPHERARPRARSAPRPRVPALAGIPYRDDPGDVLARDLHDDVRRGVLGDPRHPDGAGRDRHGRRIRSHRQLEQRESRDGEAARAAARRAERGVVDTRWSRLHVVSLRDLADELGRHWDRRQLPPIRITDAGESRGEVRDRRGRVQGGHLRPVADHRR